MHITDIAMHEARQGNIMHIMCDPPGAEPQAARPAGDARGCRSPCVRYVYMCNAHCVRYMYMLHVYLVGSVASSGGVGEVGGEVAVEVGGVVDVGGGVGG
jgi:hypothetical protein